MPLDAICLEAVVLELRAQLTGGRVDKIFQPERDELGLAVRTTASGNVRLLISANPSNCRLHITRQPRENPASPPMFCMLLRKHLTGARITEITQPPYERVVHIVFDASNEFGERVKRTLVAELMGRNSNLILVDNQERIIDCLRRVDSEMSELRPVLPGLFYRLPPPQNKAHPDDVASWLTLLETSKADENVDRLIYSSISGVSPLVARELCFRAFTQTSQRFSELDKTEHDMLKSQFESFCSLVREKKYAPLLLKDDTRPKEFSFMPIRQYGSLYSQSETANFSELLDVFFTERDTHEHRQRRASELRKVVQNALERAKRKLTLQAEEFEKTKDRERMREYGDLLMANLGSFKRGDTRVVVQNFYQSDAPSLTIPLKEHMSPHQNAEYYYKQHKKAKIAHEILKKQLDNGKIDIEYLETVLDSLDRISGDSDISDIREELTSCGYLKRSSKNNSKSVKQSKPLVFKSESGFDIYVGRNNLQNDTLTLKTASKTDIWLHVQKIPGSHVIINCNGAQPDDATLEKAAILAATYSQARNGRKVPVDYTLVKYVKKMSGGKPGMVIYDRFKTIIVDPDTT